MYLAINKCVTAVKVSNFSGHYLRNSSTLDIGVLGYIGIVQHKEHSRSFVHSSCDTLYKLDYNKTGKVIQINQLDATMIY